MRAIVTGGAGFIGSHLSRELVSRGFVVTIWDNLFRGNMENIKDVLNGENHFEKLDLSLHENINKMTAYLLEERPDYIFHYAAINGTQYFYDIPAKVLEVNTALTANLMSAIRSAKVADKTFTCKKIIYASSSEVYGEPFSLPTKETDVTYVNTESIRDSYAISKLAGEFYVKLIAQEIGLDYINLRLFNVYGPGMIGTMYGQVIPEFIKRLVDGEYPLNIYGNGEHRRSFCHVSDNVEMTVDLAQSFAKNETYNIGGSDEVSIRHLGELIMRKIGIEPQFNFMPEREGDHKRRCPDTDKIKLVIGERDLITLEVGIENLL